MKTAEIPFVDKILCAQGCGGSYKEIVQVVQLRNSGPYALYELQTVTVLCDMCRHQENPLNFYRKHKESFSLNYCVSGGHFVFMSYAVTCESGKITQVNQRPDSVHEKKTRLVHFTRYYKRLNWLVVFLFGERLIWNARLRLNVR